MSLLQSIIFDIKYLLRSNFSDFMQAGPLNFVLHQSMYLPVFNGYGYDKGSTRKIDIFLLQGFQICWIFRVSTTEISCFIIKNNDRNMRL